MHPWRLPLSLWNGCPAAYVASAVNGLQVHVPLRAPLDGGEVLKAVGLVEAAADRGLFVRAVLTEAFQAAPKHPDENACQAEMEEMVTRLADAGAGMACSVITLSDDRREATEDSLRDALEVCFGVDCRGEGMMERLSLRLADSAFCSAAVQLSVTRFEGSAAGSPRLTRTADLLAAAEAAGLRHGVDLAALERAAAALRDETKGR